MDIDQAANWLMIAAGLLTATMFHALFAPGAALKTLFGEQVEGPLAEMIVRNWGALIGFVGLLLIYGGFDPIHRLPIFIFAAATKVVFIALVLSLGGRFLTSRARMAIGIDTVFVIGGALLSTMI